MHGVQHLETFQVAVVHQPLVHSVSNRPIWNELLPGHLKRFVYYQPTRFDARGLNRVQTLDPRHRSWKYLANLLIREDSRLVREYLGEKPCGTAHQNGASLINC